MSHYPVVIPEAPDLTPYSRTDGTRPFTAEVAGVTPTQDESLSTKQYVDSSISEVSASSADPMIETFLLMGA